MAILRKTQVQGDLNVDQRLIVTGSTALKGGLSVDGTTTVNGDLKVTGDVVYTGTQNLRVKDKNIDLNVDDKGNAASTRAGASEAGITVKAIDGDVKFYYDPNEGATGAWKSNVPFGVTIEGSVANADYATTAGTANTANKVANKLTSGTGIKTFEFNGSGAEPVKVAVDEDYIKGIEVTKATTAGTATTADKVKAALTAKSGGGIVMAKAYDGSEAVEVSVDDEHVKAVAKAVKVDNATTADTATKVGKSLKLDTKTPELTFAESGATDFDGSAGRTIKLDLSAYAKTANVNESLADKADQTALTELKTTVESNTAAIGNKVDKVVGKGLSSNDYTTTERSKLAGIDEGAQVNVIEIVKVNGTALTPSDKAVNIDVPAATVTGVQPDDKFLTLTDKLLSVVASLKYDTGTKKIQLIGKDGSTAISEIDATAFIKDGMLDKAELVENPAGKPAGTYFKLTWNTDAGKDVMYVDVTSLIDVYTAENGGGLLLNDHAFSVDTTKIATVESVNAVSTKVSGLKINGQSVTESTVLTGEDIKVDGTENAQTIKAAIASAASSGVQSIGGKTGAIKLVGGGTSNGSVNLTISNDNELGANIVGLNSAAYEPAGTFVKVNDISGSVTQAADSGKFITSVTTAGGKVTSVGSAQVQAAQVGYTKPAGAPTGNTVEKAIYDIQSELELLSSGSGSISSQIDNRINALNSDAANGVTETTATTQIKVAVSESAGRLSKVEVFAPIFALPSEITLAVSASEAKLIGAAGTPNTIANAESLANEAQTAADNCVKKAGDTMTGLLTTAAAGIKFGNCTVNYNSTDAALEFVFA